MSPSTSNQIHQTNQPNAQVLLDHYIGFLRTDQGVSDATIAIRRLFVNPFLNFLEQQGALDHLLSLEPRLIHDYVIKTSPPLARASRKHLTSSLRSFLRFAHIRGMLGRDLVEAVPVILTRKLDRLPRAIPWESVQKLLAAPDRTTPAGRRDYAILLLVATYGVRIGQAIHLQRNNVDWKRGVILFPALKFGKPVCGPLDPTVAEAVLDYIRKDRGQVPFPDIFLTIRGTPRPMGIHHHMGTALKSYFQRAGIYSRGSGAHAIRHAFATRLMEQGTPLKAIADLLGHRSIESTFLYTKVDLNRLRLIASEWPEGLQ